MSSLPIHAQARPTASGPENTHFSSINLFQAPDITSELRHIQPLKMKTVSQIDTNVTGSMKREALTSRLKKLTTQALKNPMDSLKSIWKTMALSAGVGGFVGLCAGAGPGLVGGFLGGGALGATAGTVDNTIGAYKGLKKEELLSVAGLSVSGENNKSFKIDDKELPADFRATTLNYTQGKKVIDLSKLGSKLTNAEGKVATILLNTKNNPDLHQNFDKLNLKNNGGYLNEQFLAKVIVLATPADQNAMHGLSGTRLSLQDSNVKSSQALFEALGDPNLNEKLNENFDDIKITSGLQTNNSKIVSMKLVGKEGSANVNFSLKVDKNFAMDHEGGADYNPGGSSVVDDGEQASVSPLPTTFATTENATFEPTARAEISASPFSRVDTKDAAGLTPAVSSYSMALQSNSVELRKNSYTPPLQPTEPSAI